MIVKKCMLNVYLRVCNSLMGVLIACSLIGAASLDVVHACGWHYETIKAEGRSLPCTRNVALNAYPSYQEAHLEKKIQVGLMMSALLPKSLRALDELGVSWILLKDLPKAHCALKRRQELAPQAYATHANLGTYFTFSGEHDRAEFHVKETLKIDPEAHFGRERDHLILIQYLREHQQVGKFEVDMYGRSLKAQLKTIYPVKKESKKTLRDQEAALVSMISIYGASNNPLLFATLGVTLKQQGNILLAAAAFQKAIRFRHPQRRLMKRWIGKAHRRYEARYRNRARRALSRRRSRGEFAKLKDAIGKAETAANYRVTKYHKWLTKRFRKGMKFWDQSGLEEIYREQVKRKLRCALPDAQPLSEPMPRYPSHDQELKRWNTQMTDLLERVRAHKDRKSRCTLLQEAFNRGWTSAQKQLHTDSASARTETPPDQVEDRHQARVETLNELIEFGLKCPGLKIQPKTLSCLSSDKTP